MDDSSSGSVKLSTGPKVEVTGDAIVNNRKNKLIPSYELEISGSWTGVQHAHETQCVSPSRSHHALLLCMAPIEPVSCMDGHSCGTVIMAAPHCCS